MTSESTGEQLMVTINSEELTNNALKKSLEFFEYRDRMNAAVHLSEVRWSPITDLVRKAIYLREVNDGD